MDFKKQLQLNQLIVYFIFPYYIAIKNKRRSEPRFAVQRLAVARKGSSVVNTIKILKNVFSVSVAFKMYHFQPVEPILFQNLSHFIFIILVQFLITPERME